MILSTEVVGDVLVAHDQDGTELARLSLAIPLALLDALYEIPDGVEWSGPHARVRDEIMPENSRLVVQRIDALDFIASFALTRAWVRAMVGRLGEALASPLFGEATTEEPSQPISGAGTESDSPKPRRQRTSKATSET